MLALILFAIVLTIEYSCGSYSTSVHHFSMRQQCVLFVGYCSSAFNKFRWRPACFLSSSILAASLLAG